MYITQSCCFSFNTILIAEITHHHVYMREIQTSIWRTHDSNWSVHANTLSPPSLPPIRTPRRFHKATVRPHRTKTLHVVHRQGIYRFRVLCFSANSTILRSTKRPFRSRTVSMYTFATFSRSAFSPRSSSSSSVVGTQKGSISSIS